jgi:hypothetical protein
MFEKLKESFGEFFIDKCALIFTHWSNLKREIKKREKNDWSR